MTPLPPLLAPLAFLIGRWESPAICSEHWASVGDVFYGVGFVGGDFEVLKIYVLAGQVRYLTRPGGAPETAFPLVRVNDVGAVFANPAHEDPQVIEYRRTGDRLRTFAGSDRERTGICSLWKRPDAGSAPDVVAADRTTNPQHTPAMSGTSPDGTLAFTIGTWSSPGGTTPVGAYATVWKHGENGAWAPLFEAFDPID